VQSGNVEWDVVDLLPGWLPLATRLGLLERIDNSIVNRTNCIAPARNEFAVAGAIATSGIGFTSDRFGQHVPKTWAEFWNVERFPGRRGLNRRITETLEIALMADGVPAHQIYPCNIERAFRSLDRIKPSINHWIAQTEQSVSLIQQDETDFTYTFSTRVRNMQAAGARIGFSPKQNLLSVSWSGIVKGAPNRDAAMRLCNYISDPVRQIALSNLTGDTPVYLDAVRSVTPTTRRWLPDLTRSDNLFVNAQWWDGKLDELTLRFQDWLFS
jgi:putative spermidine/putrescine transport system substrate-binding protein